METLKKPGWFTSASRSLELIEKNIKDFGNEERLPPTAEVIGTVREFLNALNSSYSNCDLAEPKLFVSPNGEIVVTLGTGSKTLNIRFAPEVSFLFKDPELGRSKGKGSKTAIELAKHFQTL